MSFVLEISHNSTYSTLYSFGSTATDGEFPCQAGVTIDSQGDLFGKTYEGGANASGILYELTPNTAATPEPGALTLFAVGGLCAFSLLARKRRSK